MTFSRRAASTTRATAFTRTIHARTTLTAAEHLAHFFHGLEVLLFGDAAVAIGIHALEVFLGVTKHAASTAAFATRAHALALRLAARRSSGGGTFAARRTTEAAALTAGRTTAFGTAHAPLASLATPTLRHLASFFLVDEAVSIGIHLAKTLIAHLPAHDGKFLFVHLAIGIGVHALDEFRSTRGRITTTRRASLGATLRSAGRRCPGWATIWRRSFGCVLSGGEAGQAQDAEPVEKCFFEFHVVRVFG